MDDRVREALHAFAEGSWLRDDGALKEIYLLGVPEPDLRARCEAIGLCISDQAWAEWSLGHRIESCSSFKLADVNWIVQIYVCLAMHPSNGTFVIELGCQHKDLFADCHDRPEMLDQVEFVAKKAARLGLHFGARFAVLAAEAPNCESEDPFSWTDAFVVLAPSGPYRVLEHDSL
jgi:hypothetical protein